MDRYLLMRGGTSPLTEEMLYERYRMNNLNFKKYMQDLTAEEHIILYHVMVTEGQKVYLKELAEFLQMKMADLSPIIGDLNDRGLVRWTHDDSTSGGTYILLTERGEQVLEKQEADLTRTFSKVYETLGQEKLIEFLSLMHEVTTIFREQMEAEEI